MFSVIRASGGGFASGYYFALPDNFTVNFWWWSLAKKRQQSALYQPAIMGAGGDFLADITSFFKIADQKLELLHATRIDSPIKKFIEKRKEGVHHIALHVDSIEKEVVRLEKLGFEFISPTPKKGADNKMIVFLHPKTTNGVLVELCEEI